ncbi:MAG: MaoC family dehydratase [Myxococcales bacterium]|nr:MaoC family dehydratase [Myxococcales bacterium]
MQAGRFFEDFAIGQVLRHAVPRTVHGGDLALYIALTGDRRALSSSTEFAQGLGLVREMAPELLTFHLVFGKTVADISYNAVANLGYADVRFLEPVYPGDTLQAQSEVIGIKETSSGATGIVYVRTTGSNQRGQVVLQFVRWVLVPKRDPASPAAVAVVPSLPTEVAAARMPTPTFKLDRLGDLQWALGGTRWFDDYAEGEVIRHAGGMTLDESDHTFATRLYQNNARVHFDAQQMATSKFGRRLVYGGHVISVAHALSCSGLENVLYMAAWNSGTHVNPTFAGDTLSAWTEVLQATPVATHAGVGALRLRLCAAKNCADSAAVPVAPPLGSATPYDPRIVLSLDYWAIMPRRPGA